MRKRGGDRPVAGACRGFAWARGRPLVALVAAFIASCSSIGPGSVTRDRAQYVDAISESWKRQTLLNIVKLRYLDPPIFLDIGQIVSGYSLESGVTAGGTLAETTAVGGDTFTLNGTAKLTDRPTVTYTPLTGNKFIRALMTPLPPTAVFFMIQSGWAADDILFASAATLNGLKNQESSASGVAPPDPDFMRVLALLRKIQVSGAVAVHVVEDTRKEQATIVTFRARGITDETLADIREVRRLLNLDPDATELRLVYGATASNDHEIAVLTRSALHIMNAMAPQVDVPEEDIRNGRVPPGLDSLPDAADRPRLVSIRSGPARPEDAYAAVAYHGRWFWIADNDLRSKRAFAFMMLLFTLADTGERDMLPLLTIPAQ